MYRIITHLNSRNRKSTIQDISDDLCLSIIHVHTILTQHPEAFILEDDDVNYIPPLNITDKASFLNAIENAFPKGIRYSSLLLCYEFITSDLNEIKYNGAVFHTKYGKTKEEVYFRCSSKKNDIRDIWEKYFDPYVHLNIRTLGLNFLEIECLTTNKTDHKLTEQIDETSQPGKVFRLKHFYKSDHWSQNDIIKSKNRYFIPVHSLPFPNNTFKHSIKIQ